MCSSSVRLSVKNNSQLILSELRSFYQNLYSNQDSQDSDGIYAELLNNVTMPKVSEASKLLCEGELSIQECYSALLKFPNGKTPGNDGLTAEFYKTFWNLLGQQLTDSLNYSYQQGELSNTQKQAIIKLIEKKDRDRRYIKNWRPISLLNVDVKIASKALALRLEKVLPDIIGNDQYAYVEGRTIFDAVRSIEDIMEYTKLREQPGIMTAFDFEKAFDSLSWNFLTSTLQSFNFGNSFINWVKTLYSNISSCVLNNGFSTQLFDVQRGVRQGDPLSPYLFIIALEFLLLKIRGDSKIRGVMIGNNETKVTAFADDLTSFIRDIPSFKILIDTIERFGNCSGLKLNSDKTEALWLGNSYNNCQLPNIDVDKINKPMKILGIYFTYDWRKKQELNFEAILKSLRKTLNSWQWRNLSLYGKIQIVKTFAIPKFMFRASVISLSKEIVKQVNSIIYKFVWNGKDKIKRLALISDYENGGLRMPHIEAMIDTQRIHCLKKFVDKYSSPWKYFLSHMLKNQGGKFILHCNFSETDLPKDIPKFYLDCFAVWCKLMNNNISTENQIVSEILWNNRYLRISNNTVSRLCSKRNYKEPKVSKL